MKKYLISTFFVFFINIFWLFSQSLKLSVVHDSRLEYFLYDLNSKKTDSSTIDVLKSDFIFSEVFYQKNNWLIFLNRDDSGPKNAIYKNGKLLCKDTIESSELQFSNINNNQYFVIDRFVNFENDSFNLSVMDTCQEYFGISKRQIFPSTLMQNPVDTPLFVFLGEFNIIEPQTRWSYELKVFDIQNSNIDIIDTVFQGNSGNEKGFFLLNNYSYWVNNGEITYLLYKPLKKRCKIEIRSYNAFSKSKRMISSFFIPTYGRTLNIRYLYGGNGKLYLSTGDRVYEVNGKRVKEILHFENKEIVGMSF